MTDEAVLLLGANPYIVIQLVGIDETPAEVKVHLSIDTGGGIDLNDAEDREGVVLMLQDIIEQLEAT